MQDVRRGLRQRLSLQRPPLLDAEAVLLVDDRHAQRAEGDLILDQRMGADHDERAAAAHLGDRGAALGRGRALHQRDDADAERDQEVGEPDEVLRCERLGRRHQRPLAPLSTARTRACAATAVLPEPTSPCSSRRIGRSRPRSASMAAIARSWAPVSSKGRAAR